MTHVRSAARGDAAAWLRMRDALWPDPEARWHAEEIDQYFAGALKMPLEVLMAIDDGGAAVGFAELSIRAYAEDCETDRVAYLEGWYVDPHIRRQGVGRALVAAAEQWALAQGCSEFGSDALIDNDISLTAHLALGFEETEQIRCFKKLIGPRAATARNPTTNRSMPSSTVIPVLGYRDVREAVAWLCSSFGFVERLRIGDHRAQLAFGNGAIVVAAGQPAAAAADSVMVRVADVDAHHHRARQGGARIIGPPTDYPYGERQYTAEDIGGHRWTFSQSVADVDPAVWGGVLFE